MYLLGYGGEEVAGQYAYLAAALAGDDGLETQVCT